MIECRGRNGWFVLHEANIRVSDGEARISISSKNPYRDVAPIYLAGPTSEMKSLLADLQAHLGEATR
jgi:hypothetical protein